MKSGPKILFGRSSMLPLLHLHAHHNGFAVRSCFVILLNQCQTLTILRFGRDPRSTLFSAYDAQQRPKSQSTSPYRANASPYNPSSERSIHSSSNPAFGAYPGSQANGGPNNGSKFRSATPNQKGQYSDAVLNELESQNDAQLEGMSAKVRMLKDVCCAFCIATVVVEAG